GIISASMRIDVQDFGPNNSEGGLSGIASYQLLFDNNPLPMWVYDTATYRFLMVNPAAVKLYGYTKAEFLQMTLMEIRPAEEIPSFIQLVESDRDCLNNAGHWNHITKDGSLLHVEVNSHALPLE